MPGTTANTLKNTHPDMTIFLVNKATRLFTFIETIDKIGLIFNN